MDLKSELPKSQTWTLAGLTYGLEVIDIYQKPAGFWLNPGADFMCAPCPFEEGGQRDRDEVEIARGEVPKLHPHKVCLGTSPRAAPSGPRLALLSQGVNVLDAG